MTTEDLSRKNGKSNGLKVFRTPDGQFYVESSEGKICYRVSGNNGSKACTCGDYINGIAKDPAFVCKHILAVINGNGNVKSADVIQNPVPKLDERFITRIKTKEFVLYSGLLDLAHQKGIRRLIVEALQYPSKENKMEAICRATVESASGETYVELADANPVNVNRMVAEHILRVAATRAKARALRDFTNIGMTCLEELGELEDSSEDDNGRSRNRNRRDNTHEASVNETKQAPSKQGQSKGEANTDDRRTEPNKGKEATEKAGKGAEAATQPPDSGDQAPGERQKDQKASDPQDQKGQVRPSEAQIKAIEKLAERRGINERQLVTIFADKFHKPLQNITAEEAKNFIKHLQQAA